MTTELWMLLAAAGLQWALIMGASTPRLLANGIPWSLGNRDVPSKEVPPWAERMQRASNNMMENLPIFAVAVLVVHAADASTETSALGATIFLVARLVHAGFFVAGVKVLRSGAWAVSIAGLFMVVSVLF